MRPITKRSPFPRFLIVVILVLGITLFLPGWLVMATVPLKPVSQLVEEGKMTYQQGHFQRSQQVWQQLVDLFADRGDALNQAMALGNLSLTDQQLGQWEAAEKAITASQALLQTLEIRQEAELPAPQQRLLAQILDIQGQLHLNRGQFDQALQSWQQTSQLYQAIADVKGQFNSQINQAQAYQELGMYPRACQILLNALTIEQKDCQLTTIQLKNLPADQPLSLQILALKQLGNILRMLGKPLMSYDVLKQAWQLANQEQNAEALAEITLNLGNTARSLGNQKMQEGDRRISISLGSSVDCQEGTKGNATKFYRQAVACYQTLAQKDTFPLLQLQARINTLSLLIQMRYWPDLLVLIPKIQTQLPTLPISRTTITARLKLAQGLMCVQWGVNAPASTLPPPMLQSCPNLKVANQSNQTQLAELASFDQINRLVQVALEQAQRLGDNLLITNAWGQLGAIAYQQGNFTLAQSLTEKSLQSISSLHHPELVYLWQWQLGRLSQVQGNIPQAIAAYTSAYNLLQSLRRELVGANADIQFAFRDRVEPVYRELVTLLLQSETPSQENLQQSLAIIESLQVAELNNFFQEACLEPNPKLIQAIDAQSAVIYAITLPQGLGVILALPEQPLQYYKTVLATSPTSPVAPSIETAINALMKNTLNPTPIKRLNLRPNQQLYQWLLSPLEPALQHHGIKNLIFVLDGVLRGIPLAALQDGKQYLIEKYSLTLTPGLQLLNPRPSDNQVLNALIGGLAQARQGFNALPGVMIEVEKIASVLPTEVLMDESFTQDRLKAEIAKTDFPIVHLATHAQFSSKAEDTFLLTWDERINVKNLDQLLRVRGQTGSIELLILSACQTATGDNRAPLGLAGVAIRSGARSTLATLWPVNDESTAQFMSKFYAALEIPGMSKTGALRQAQLSLFQQSQYQHPYYWAPFVLIGNWQ